jgi:N-acetylmuramoyl-L-alanine amidase
MAGAGGGAPSARAGEGLFNTVRVGGRNYVNVADVARFYRFDGNWRQAGLDVTLRSKTRTFRFRVNNRECFVNGVRLWLNDAPLEARSSVLLSEVDVVKTLDPVFRPWAVRKLPVKTVMIDPGHGGEDQGTTGTRGALEKHYALDLAARVEQVLRSAGFRTLMTRRRDSYVSLEDRADMANSSDADLFVSLHLNSAKPARGPKGIETYCLTPAGLSSTGALTRRFGLGRFAEEPGNRCDRNNMLLAFLIQQGAVSGIKGLEDRGVKRARFHVIRAAEMPAVLVESGFLSNPEEEKLILTGAYRQQLAAAIGGGIARYARAMSPPRP